MATIPRDFVNDLLNRSSILDVISPVVPLKKAGKEYTACCPFHKEKTPSFTVSPEKNFYHCFGCQKSGDPIQFLIEYHKMNYVEAVTELAKQHGLTVPAINDQKPRENWQPLYDLHECAAQFYAEQLQKHPQAAAAQRYLKKRGLTHQIIEKFSIGFAPPGWDNFINHARHHQFSIEQCVKAGLVSEKSEGKIYDKFRHRIMFPIRDKRGRIIAFGGRSLSDDNGPKYLNSPETPLFHKGRELYGLWQATQEPNIKGIVVVEGYMDVVALAQYGIPGAVATLGTATTSEHIQQCFRFHKQLFFCFDGDGAGQKAAWRALETSLPLLKENHSVRFCFLPQDEDPDSFIRKLGTDAFTARLNQATSLPDFFFDHLSKTLDLKQLDQKAQLANRAAPYIQQIPDNVLRALMFNTLSGLVQLPLSVLQDIQQDSPSSHASVDAVAASSLRQSTRVTAGWRQNSVGKLPSPMRVVISLLVQSPSLVSHVSDLSEIEQSPLPGADLLLKLVPWLQQQPEGLTTELLLRQWPDDRTRGHLEKCAAHHHCMPEQGLVEEFTGALSKLMDSHRRLMVDNLLKTAHSTGLSEQQKRELTDLLRRLSIQATSTQPGD